MDHLYIQGARELLSDYYWECPLSKTELFILTDMMSLNTETSEMGIVENILKNNGVIPNEKGD